MRARCGKHFVNIFRQSTKTLDFETGAVILTLQQTTFIKVLPDYSLRTISVYRRDQSQEKAWHKIG